MCYVNAVTSWNLFGFEAFAIKVLLICFQIHRIRFLDNRHFKPTNRVGLIVMDSICSKAESATLHTSE